MPSTQSPSVARANFSNRVSRLLSRGHESNRTSNACEVPIFISPTPNRLSCHQAEYQNRASPIHSTIEEANLSGLVQPLSVASSSVYSASPTREHVATFEEQDRMEAAESTVEEVEDISSNTSYSNSDTQRLVDRRKRRKRARESLRQKIEGKRRLSLAFGITVFAAIITYLTLAVTKTAQGLMFHILSVLFILILTGVFLHSTITLIMLQKRRSARQARHTHWHRAGQTSGSSVSSARGGSETSLDPKEYEVTEKPIAIVVGGDEVVTTTPKGKNKKVIRPPPPVYGNFRESKRMNPDMIFWHKREPSPTTPTYDEAMMSVQQAIGFQPPQYVSPRRERNVQAEGQQYASNVHPLERERLVGLMGNTMSSQRQL